MAVKPFTSVNNSGKKKPMKSLISVFCDFPCLPEGSKRARFWKFHSAGAIQAATNLPSWLELKGLDDQSLHM